MSTVNRSRLMALLLGVLAIAAALRFLAKHGRELASDRSLPNIVLITGQYPHTNGVSALN